MPLASTAPAPFHPTNNPNEPSRSEKIRRLFLTSLSSHSESLPTSRLCPADTSPLRSLVVPRRFPPPRLPRQPAVQPPTAPVAPPFPPARLSLSLRRPRRSPPLRPPIRPRQPRPPVVHSPAEPVTPPSLPTRRPRLSLALRNPLAPHRSDLHPSPASTLCRIFARRTRNPHYPFSLRRPVPPHSTFRSIVYRLCRRPPFLFFRAFPQHFPLLSNYFFRGFSLI